MTSDSATLDGNPSSPDAQKKRVFIQTYGCQMNEYDTQKLYKILENDYVPVSSSEEADLVLVNTCSVREKPEQKLYSLLGRISEQKEGRPELLVGVCGCVAQQEGEKIIKRSKAVDFVFGTHNLSLVPSLIQLRKNGSPPQVAVDYRDEWEDLPLGFAEHDPSRNGARGHVTAFVSISRGCNKSCAYCIVPTTRGPEVSRSVDEIEREIKIAVHRGSKEIVLLGQTVNSYGLDLTPRVPFVTLLERVANIPGVMRIRFTSPHPQEIREDFINFVTSNSKICRHVHMPLQSGSDAILKAMNRNYRMNKYRGIIESLRSRIPDIGLSTDLIVGFPGESEGDFLDTINTLEEFQFDNVYAYAYSERPGTPAALLSETLSTPEKLFRLNKVIDKQTEIIGNRLSQWIGRTAEVLVDGPNPARPGCMQGRTSQNIMVNFDKEDPSLALGALVTANIVSHAKFTLNGSVGEAAMLP